MKSIENVLADVRRTEFNKFKELEDYNVQNMEIANNVKEVQKKRSYVQANNAISNKTKTFTWEYQISNLLVRALIDTGSEVTCVS